MDIANLTATQTVLVAVAIALMLSGLVAFILLSVSWTRYEKVLEVEGASPKRPVAHPGVVGFGLGIMGFVCTVVAKAIGA